MAQQNARNIFTVSVLEAAKHLIGARLILGRRIARIVETEAYRAEDDPASHAYRGRTVRNGTMWGESGHAYIFLNYGVHWMLNVSAHEPGSAAGVLVRAARPLEGLEEFRLARPGIADVDLLRGPGKLSRGFGITRDYEGIDLFDPASELRIEFTEETVPIVSGPRIGLAKGKGDEFPWRFADATRLDWVSKPVPPRYR